MFIAFCSALFLFGLSSAFFVVLYLQQGLSLKELLEPGLIYNVVFFGRLGLSSTLIWAPIMILSVAGLPRNWTQETW